MSRRSPSPRRRRSPSPPRQGSRIFVANLPLDVTENELEDLFYKFGRIEDIELRRDRTNDSTIAFVQFADYKAADEAIEGRDGTRLGFHRIRIERSRQRLRRPGEFGRSDRSGYGREGGGSGPAYGPPRRSEFRVRVYGLPPTASWQDLKDHMRRAGDVGYANIDGGVGVVEYSNGSDMDYALRKLHGSVFRNIFHTAKIRVERDSGDDYHSRRRPSVGRERDSLQGTIRLRSAAARTRSASVGDAEAKATKMTRDTVGGLGARVRARADAARVAKAAIASVKRSEDATTQAAPTKSERGRRTETEFLARRGRRTGKAKTGGDRGASAEAAAETRGAHLCLATRMGRKMRRNMRREKVMGGETVAEGRLPARLPRPAAGARNANAKTRERTIGAEAEAKTKRRRTETDETERKDSKSARRAETETATTGRTRTDAAGASKTEKARGAEGEKTTRDTQSTAETETGTKREWRKRIGERAAETGQARQQAGGRTHDPGETTRRARKTDAERTGSRTNEESRLQMVRQSERKRVSPRDLLLSQMSPPL
uniref:Splicing factor,arginine/serine-rich 1, related n=1 Tax=Neospora caninum (strain Liverpool) TaxID=572307 RepID=A0A0F7U9Y3_NEOCL|nr:TPA: Splicing factor,arginine/serine-rich 1, related [Neospora caninum Liverpool]